MILVVRRYSDVLAILAGLAIYGALLIRLKCIDVDHLVAVMREYQAQAGKVLGKDASLRSAVINPDDEEPTKGAV